MEASRLSGLPSIKTDQLLLILFLDRCCTISCINREQTCNSPCHLTPLSLPLFLEGAGKCLALYPLPREFGIKYSDIPSRLMSIYNNLHASIHAKNTHVKVHHCVSRSASSFAWVTPIFELYCVAEPNANRNALVQSASKIAQWVQQEEERLFIIGGAVCATLL